MKMLIDADMLLFRMCAACEEYSPFNKEVLIKACPIETWRNIQLRIQQFIDLFMVEFDTKPEIVMCLSPKGETFRYQVFPDYKANRKGKSKPVLYNDMVEKLKKEYTVECWDNLEADDVLGILADKENTVIVSSDKDLKQISTYHMDLAYPEFIDFVEEEDGYKFFLKQCIAGDSTDCYYGVPGLGMKKAEKILEEEGYSWATVVECYTSAMSPKSKGGKKIESYNLGLTEEDALVTARLAWILKDKEEYDGSKFTVKLWNPADRSGWEEG